MRPIRVLIAILGLDQHETGALAIARLLRDAGMEVIYLGRFNLPAAIVTAAIQDDVDIIGLSCHSWEYLHYLDELTTRVVDAGLHIPIVIGGSVITEADKRSLAGVAAAFGPTATTDEIVETIESLVPER
ncbi:MAG TPA: cobalamin-dependent protein [Candidatus Kryptonia bacterium]|nr:cobalamin-dependent protein [Candidatus Kryptonia bacterium]